MAKNSEVTFIEQNKRAVMEELSGSLQSVRALTGEILPEAMAESENVPAGISSVLLQLNMTMGYVFALYNELQTLEYGFSEDNESRPIGFASIIDGRDD